MASAIRHGKALAERIDKCRDDLIKRFENLVGLASIDRTDRTSTAAVQYNLQAETAALIRATEDVQTLIRQLQELWLFGQLNTLGISQVQQQTDADARAVAGLLRELEGRG